MTQTPGFDCARKRRLLDAFVDHELSSAEHQDIVEHLERCAGCQTELDSIKFLIKSLHELPRPLLSEDFLLRDLPANISKFPLYCKRYKKAYRNSYSKNYSVLAVRIWSCAAALVLFFIGSLGFWHISNYMHPSSPEHFAVPNYPQAEAQIALLEDLPGTFDLSNSITNSIGLATDEDGLYAIKM